uniref:Uncharacterized protein n=1 Tax=Glossina palpalis gambiensis TaxID=67801 RepID=A0A1B0BVW4_9MUSC
MKQDQQQSKPHYLLIVLSTTGIETDKYCFSKSCSQTMMDENKCTRQIRKFWGRIEYRSNRAPFECWYNL